MTFTVPAVVARLRLIGMNLLDAMRPLPMASFSTHYIFILWLQYAVYDYSWPAVVKFAVVFAGTLALSWAATWPLRKIPVVARMI